nr:MAG TPA: hypothetical protein [Caudoviricetes sp.]
MVITVIRIHAMKRIKTTQGLLNQNNGSTKVKRLNC